MMIIVIIIIIVVVIVIIIVIGIIIMRNIRRLTILSVCAIHRHECARSSVRFRSIELNRIAIESIVKSTISENVSKIFRI